jgi:hypothetical protein
LRWTELAASRVINASDVARFGDHLGFLSHADYLIITSNRRWDATAIAPTGGGIGDPPHRSVRARFGHTAPTLGD